MSDSTLVLLIVAVPILGLLVLLVVDRPRRGRHRPQDTPHTAWAPIPKRPRRRRWWRRC